MTSLLIDGDYNMDNLRRDQLLAGVFNSIEFVRTGFDDGEQLCEPHLKFRLLEHIAA